VKIFSIKQNTVIYLYICLCQKFTFKYLLPSLRQLDEVQLPQLAQELRDFIIDIVSVKEGHLMLVWV
jgi:hypothetical protein